MLTLIMVSGNVLTIYCHLGISFNMLICEYLFNMIHSSKERVEIFTDRSRKQVIIYDVYF
jgi:hypothetical protein